MSEIVKLWNEEKLPIKNGIYFANGESFSLSIQFYPNLFIEIGKKFDLASFLNDNPDYLTNIDITKKIKMNTGEICLLGEGSYGSEGVIAYKTPDEHLKWVMYFEKSNPFINAIELSNKFLEVESSANYKIIIDLENPIMNINFR